MNRYITLGHRLPHALSAPLFGDRKRWGLSVKPDDPCWLEWQQTMLQFYDSNQKQGVGEIVNNAGYQVMATRDLSGCNMLEIGPGEIKHLPFWQPLQQPPQFTIADINPEMLARSKKVLDEAAIPCKTALLQRGEARLPFADNQFDVVVSFYALEHIYPLTPYLQELHRVLKPGGQLMGAIPAEGGLGWGLGRFLTSRRWLKHHTSIDPDKIICWEHPNFAEQVLAQMDQVFPKQERQYWPCKIPLMDVNLVVKFIYQK